jgi:hypothetical protein
MDDPTEGMRRARFAELNAEADNRTELEQRHGQVWDSTQLRAEFEVIGFAAPYVMVRERKTSKVGSLEFQHSPRFYFNFEEDK